MDDSSGINSQEFSTGGVYVFDFHDRKADRGLSSFWAKDVFTGNWSYELPFAKSMRGVGGFLLKGWQANSIVTMQPGHAFEVRLGFNRSGNLNTVNYAMHERPDVKPGVNPILGGPERSHRLRQRDPTVAANWGVITSTVTTSRQVQFVLKVVF